MCLVHARQHIQKMHRCLFDTFISKLAVTIPYLSKQSINSIEHTINLLYIIITVMATDVGRSIKWFSLKSSTSSFDNLQEMRKLAHMKSNKCCLHAFLLLKTSSER